MVNLGKASRMKKILVVANDFPYPPAHGAAVDMWNRIRILVEMGYRVDLLASVKETPAQESIDEVKRYVGNLWIVSRSQSLGSFLSWIPFQVRSRAALAKIKLDGDFDAVILEADYVAEVLKNPGVRGSKLILRIHNEQVLYFRELAQGSKNWLRKAYFLSESFKFRLFSPVVLRKCNLLWFISDSERAEHVRKKREDESKSYFLPTHVSPENLRPFVSGEPTALFIGSLTISHNTDSVVWYLENVHSRLLDIEGYSFQVAGRTAGQSITWLKEMVQRNRKAALEADPAVLDDLYRKASVFVNPVIVGAGIKIKVVQALEAGVPVVSTTMGIEGTGFKDGVHVLVADTPAAFTECVRRILTEKGLGEFLVGNAQSYLRDRYDMKVNMDRTLSQLLAANEEVKVVRDAR